MYYTNTTIQNKLLLNTGVYTLTILKVKHCK